jgi:hypothetical protein
MAPTNNVYVWFACTAVRIARDSYPNILARIPIIVAPGERNVYASYDPFFVEIRNPNISNFTVCLLDDDMNLVDVQGTPCCT